MPTAKAGAESRLSVASPLLQDGCKRGRWSRAATEIMPESTLIEDYERHWAKPLLNIVSV
jgi:hypothetical protein